MAVKAVALTILISSQAFAELRLSAKADDESSRPEAVSISGGKEKRELMSYPECPSDFNTAYRATVLPAWGESCQRGDATPAISEWPGRDVYIFSVFPLLEPFRFLAFPCPTKGKYCQMCRDCYDGYDDYGDNSLSCSQACKKCPEQVVIGGKKIILDGDVCITGKGNGG